MCSSDLVDAGDCACGCDHTDIDDGWMMLGWERRGRVAVSVLPPKSDWDGYSVDAEECLECCPEEGT